MPPAKKIAAKKAATPAKKAAPAKAASQATVTLKQIAAELAESHDLPKKHAEAMLGDLVATTAKHLKKGDKIRLTGLGILQLRARHACSWVPDAPPESGRRILSAPSPASRTSPAGT